MRYYFNLREGSDYISDEEGLDLPHRDAAFEAAIRGARGLLAAEVLQGRLSLSTIMEVRDDRGEQVFELPFSRAVSVNS
jgi:hypothetical protein